MPEYIVQVPVSLTILLITLFISLYAYFVDSTLFEKLILQPQEVQSNKSFYRLISSAFLHGDITYLVINVVTMAVFCFSIEAKAGSLYFSGLYFSSLLLGNIFVYYKYRNNPRYYNLGASGALIAVVISHMILVPAYEIKLLFLPIYVPGALYIGAYISYLYYAVQAKTDNINHEPHLIGAVTGLVFTVIRYPQLVSNLFERG